MSKSGGYLHANKENDLVCNQGPTFKYQCIKHIVAIHNYTLLLYSHEATYIFFQISIKILDMSLNIGLLFCVLGCSIALAGSGYITSLDTKLRSYILYIGPISILYNIQYISCRNPGSIVSVFLSLTHHSSFSRETKITNSTQKLSQFEPFLKKIKNNSQSSIVLSADSFY